MFYLVYFIPTVSTAPRERTDAMKLTKNKKKKMRKKQKRKQELLAIQLTQLEQLEAMKLHTDTASWIHSVDVCSKYIF